VAGQALQPLDPFEEIISILQLDRHVEMRIGYIPDEEIPKLLAKVQTMVLPYRSIDQSGVLLLGMAAGKTMITTCVGGIPEVIRHEQTGLLVPPDDPQALAHAIAQCIQDPDFAQQLGRAAQADVQSRFDWNAIARQTESFYRMVAQP
jgi:glycosyltransferase involved in cell wall biosynthesis